MVNRILYWFVTLPVFGKAGCLGTLGVFFACICLFAASIPGARARVAAQATATIVAVQAASTQRVIDATSTSVAHVTATSIAQQQATRTSIALAALATQTVIAAPTATAQANAEATRTAVSQATATAEAHAEATMLALAQATATAQAEIDANSTAVAQATVVAAQTAEAVAAAEAAAATQEAIAQATATIVSYRTQMPKGWWFGKGGGVGVVVGDFRYVQETSIYSSGQGSRFVAFGIAVYNESGRTIHVNPYRVTLVDSNGTTYAHSTATYDYWRDPLDAVDVRTGNNANGGLVFLIPDDAIPAQVVYDVGGLFGPTIVVDLLRAPDETE